MIDKTRLSPASIGRVMNRYGLSSEGNKTEMVAIESIKAMLQEAYTIGRNADVMHTSHKQGQKKRQLEQESL